MSKRFLADVLFLVGAVLLIAGLARLGRPAPVPRGVHPAAAVVPLSPQPKSVPRPVVRVRIYPRQAALPGGSGPVNYRRPTVDLRQHMTCL